MPEPAYQFFCLDLSNPTQPMVTEANRPKRGKKSAYPELRRLAANAKPGQLIIMQLPDGGLRAINTKGEVAVLKQDQSLQATLRLLPAA